MPAMPCPSCKRPINASFAQCPFCKAATRSTPQAAPTARNETPHELFERLGGPELFRANALRTAHDEPAVAALDVWITAQFGSAPVPEAARESADGVRFETIVGCWLGEYFTRVLGGRWEDVANPRVRHVTWPNGLRTCPPAYFSKRLQNGAAHAIYTQVVQLIGILAAQRQLPPSLPNAPEPWWEQAVAFASGPRNFTLAVDFARGALSRKPAHVPWLVQLADWCELEAERRGAALPADLDPMKAWHDVLAADPTNAHARAAIATRLVTQDPAKALTLAEQVLASRPGSAPAHAARGRALVALHRPEEALVAFARAGSLDPTLAAAHVERARTLLELGRAKDALVTLQHARRVATPTHEGTEVLARVLEKSERWTDAHTTWKQLEATPRIPEQVRLRAATRAADIAKTKEFRLDSAAQTARRGDAAGAVSQYRELVRDHPGLVDAWLTLALGHAATGRTDDALAALDAALAADPRCARAYDHKAVTLGRLKRFADAMTTLDQGLRLLPNDPMRLTRRGVMVALNGDFPGAVPWLQKAIDAGDSGDATLFLADAEERAGHLASATQRIRQWFASTPTPDPRKAATARRALHKLEHGRPVDPARGEALLEQGFALDQQGRHGEAFHVYERALEADSSRADTWHNFGASLAHARDDAGAIDAFRTAEQLGSGAVSQLARAEALVRSGALDDALALLDTLLDTNTEHVDALRTRSRLRTLAGRLDDARDDLDRYLGLRPGDDDARARKDDLLTRTGLADTNRR